MEEGKKGEEGDNNTSVMCIDAQHYDDPPVSDVLRT